MIIQKLCFRNLKNTYSNFNTLSQQQNSDRNVFQQICRTFKRNIRNEISPQGRTTEKSILPSPFQNVTIDSGYIKGTNIFKATVFAITFSAGSFIGTTIWEYENLRMRLKHRAEQSRNKTFSFFNSKYEKKNDIQHQLKSWWNSLTPGEKVFVPICAMNVIVFGLWRIPQLQGTMVKYFCSNPAGRAICWPMCLSTFSHYSLFHIFANMYVLHSFSNVAVSTLGKEQFVCLYLSAGVLSSLASYMYKAATAQVGLSLGASGAIMAVLAYVCCEYPETQLSILFLPMLTFSAGSAIKVIMGIDLAGVLLGWKIFDHAAHLGGAAFGLFWCWFGKRTLWPERERVLKKYHELRTK